MPTDSHHTTPVYSFLFDHGLVLLMGYVARSETLTHSEIAITGPVEPQGDSPTFSNFSGQRNLFADGKSGRVLPMAFPRYCSVSSYSLLDWRPG